MSDRDNDDVGMQQLKDINDKLSVPAALDIARRATNVERERCLSEIEALYADWRNVEDPGTVLLVLRTAGERIAGGDVGPHSDAALAWRRRVTGEVPST